MGDMLRLENGFLMVGWLGWEEESEVKAQPRKKTKGRKLLS